MAHTYAHVTHLSCDATYLSCVARTHTRTHCIQKKQCILSFHACTCVRQFGFYLGCARKKLRKQHDSTRGPYASCHWCNSCLAQGIAVQLRMVRRIAESISSEKLFSRQVFLQTIWSRERSSRELVQMSFVRKNGLASYRNDRCFVHFHTNDFISFFTFFSFQVPLYVHTCIRNTLSLPSPFLCVRKHFQEILIPFHVFFFPLYVKAFPKNTHPFSLYTLHNLYTHCIHTHVACESVQTLYKAHVV